LLLVTSRIRENFFSLHVYISSTHWPRTRLCLFVWLCVCVCVCVCVVRECACVKNTRKNHTTHSPSRVSLSHTQNTSAQTHSHTCAPLASSVASSHSSCCCCILKYVDRALGRRRAGTAAKFPKVPDAEWQEGNATPHEGNAWVGVSPRACMHGHVRKYACTKRYNDKRYIQYVSSPFVTNIEGKRHEHVVRMYV
jgi:hypothetical protein